ncbi:MAG: InlB B-repeat-containing protein, partial [Clostridia bacterium]|nr:InlB B-repeat-containing protein [Clostridia bacterium]
MKKLFRNVSAIALSACMALSASAVALAGWNEEVYTPSVDVKTTVHNWSDAYGEDGYILIGDATAKEKPVIYSDMYQDSAYAKDETFSDVESTKGTSNKIQGGFFADSFYNYRGTFYAYAQAGKAWAIIQENGGATLAESTYRSQVGANAEAKADLTNGTCDGGLLSTAPISRWGISGTTLSNVTGHAKWTTPAGDVINVRVQSSTAATPYTLAFTLTEDAVKDSGIYVTARTYNMKGGEVMLKNAWYANNDDKSIAAGSVAAIQTVSVTGDGFVTFYIETAGDYTIVANDTANQEGITGIFFDKSEPVPAPLYDAVAIDNTTLADWEGAYGNAGYVIYAGKSNTDRYVYTKNIYAGDSEGAYSKLDAWPTATDNQSRESNYHPFKVGGADPDGTIISQFNDQTYLVRGDLSTASGLYVPGSLDINKYMTKASSPAAQSAVAFYVPQSALATAKAKTGNSVIYVTMYMPGESATRSAAATNTIKMLYANSEDITKLAPRALLAGSDTNSAGGLLFANDGTSLRSTDATLAASQTYTFDEGDANGIYATFELRTAGYYAIQTLDTVERGTWSGIFFDYDKPVRREPTSFDGAVKMGDAKFDADRVGRYGEDYYFILASADSNNDKAGMLDSNLFTEEAYADGLVAFTGQSTTAGATGLLKPNAGDYKADAPIKNIKLNTYIKNVDHKSIYQPMLSDGVTPSTAIGKPNGSSAAAGMAGFGFEVYTSDTIYVTAYYALSSKGEVGEEKTEYLDTFDVVLYKGTMLDVAASNVANATSYMKTLIELDSATVEETTGAYVTFKISGKGSYVIYNKFFQFTSSTQSSPMALYVSTSEPVAKNVLSVDYAGGEAQADLSKYFDENTADITLPTPEKAGYVFAGWVVNGAPAVMEYTIDCSETTADVSAVATWTATEYAISVNLNGGTATIPATYTIEDVIVLPTPVKTGYDFAGWKVNGADAVMEYTIENATGAIDLVATWTAKEFTVSFDGEGVDLADAKVIWNEAYDLSEYVPVRGGYTFAGWYYNSYPIPTIGTYDQVPSDITLTASWELATYDITVNLNGGEATAIADTYTIESEDIVLPTPVKANYTFAGWKVNGANAVMEYTIATGSYGDVALEA